MKSFKIWTPGREAETFSRPQDWDKMHTRNRSTVSRVLLKNKSLDFPLKLFYTGSGWLAIVHNIDRGGRSI